MHMRSGKVFCMLIEINGTRIRGMRLPILNISMGLNASYAADADYWNQLFISQLGVNIQIDDTELLYLLFLTRNKVLARY